MNTHKGMGCLAQQRVPPSPPDVQTEAWTTWGFCGGSALRHVGGEPGGLSGPVQRALRLGDSTLEHEKGVSASNILLVGHGQRFSSDTHSVLPGFSSSVDFLKQQKITVAFFLKLIFKGFGFDLFYKRVFYFFIEVFGVRHTASTFVCEVI